MTAQRRESLRERIEQVMHRGYRPDRHRDIWLMFADILDELDELSDSPPVTYKPVCSSPEQCRKDGMVAPCEGCHTERTN